MNRSVSTLSAALVAATLALAAPALAAQTPNRAPLTPTIVAEREARVSAADRGRIRGNTDAPI